MGIASDAETTPTKLPRHIRKLRRGFELLAKNAQPFLQGTPLQTPIAVLNACIDLANTMADNGSTVKALFRQTSNRLRIVNKALIQARSESAADRVREFTKILIREIQGLDALSRRGIIEKALLSKEDTQTIVETIKRLDGHLGNFQIDVIMSIERNAENAVEQLNAIRIESWPRSKHATYGADTDAGTTLLKHPSPDAPRVFWLTGHAGSGKSTIAFSIAQHYRKKSRKYIIPSIVYQLARHSSSFRRALVAINQFGAPDEPDEQLKTLLVEPWKECLRQRQFQIPSLLIVIDALDEIADSEGSMFLQELLGVIGDGHLSGLRFIVTSRPDPDIVALCESFPPDTVCRLHQVDMDDVSGDIRTFLHAKLPALKDQPQLEEVVRRSRGFFIYAATAVRYATPRPKMNPGEQLSLLDKFLASGPNSRNRFLLDRLYKQILWAAFSDLEEEQFRPRLRILHAILSIPSALSVRTIAQLDPAFSENLVEIVVSDLHAVLYIQGNKIYSYHSSFPDFIFRFQAVKIQV
ncbi:hypothetical protein B0H14DRAFT_3654141 [Mycena olivaceomarginata]|nr:hypothetical protein B0H14DRAFT_3654141 [Mycena olivaceomarginata]